MKIVEMFVEEDFLRGKKRLTLAGYLALAILAMVVLSLVILAMRFATGGLRRLG